MKALINEDGSINPHRWFTFTQGKNKGKRLQVVGSQSDGWGVLECIDTIKNLESQKTTQIKRGVLCQWRPLYLDDADALEQQAAGAVKKEHKPRQCQLSLHSNRYKTTLYPSPNSKKEK